MEELDTIQKLRTEANKYHLLWSNWCKKSLIDPQTNLPNHTALLLDSKLERERCEVLNHELYGLIEIPIDAAFFDSMCKKLKKWTLSTERLYRASPFSYIILTYHDKSARYQQLKDLLEENHFTSRIRIKPVTSVRLSGTYS